MEAIETVVEGRLPEAEAAVREALAAEGFGVLTEIDVSATLAAKLGVERPPLKILGACNPVYADAALAADRSVALLLPCNVVLEDAGGERTRVSMTDPRALLAVAGRPDGGALEELGAQAAEALERARRRLERR